MRRSCFLLCLGSKSALRPSLKTAVLVRYAFYSGTSCPCPDRYLTAAADHRKKFVLLLAKAFLTFGAPSHRVETQLFAAADQLLIQASFAFIPGIIMVSFNDGETRTTELHFVRSSGRIALSALNSVHDVYRDFFDDRITVQDGIATLDRIFRAPPLYPLIVRCGLAFVCASVSSVRSLSAVALSTCGSAEPVPVSCSTWVSSQQRRVLSMRTYTSMCVSESICFTRPIIHPRISVSIIVSFVA